MKILTLDTSGQTAGVAVIDDNTVVGEININTRGRMTHSEMLLPLIDQIFDATGLTLPDMDYIACVSGPGSFTGLRIGAATAQGLARGAGKPLVAVPTLDALAYNGVCASPAWIVPLMDARRSQVYTAFYQSDGLYPRRTSDYLAASVEDVLTRLTAARPVGRVIFLGDGASAYGDILKTAPFDHAFAPVNNRLQRAASAGVCAAGLIHAGLTVDFSLLYIRKPQAERARLGDTT